MWESYWVDNCYRTVTPVFFLIFPPAIMELPCLPLYVAHKNGARKIILSMALKEIHIKILSRDYYNIQIGPSDWTQTWRVFLIVKVSVFLSKTRNNYLRWWRNIEIVCYYWQLFTVLSIRVWRFPTQMVWGLTITLFFWPMKLAVIYAKSKQKLLEKLCNSVFILSSPHPLPSLSLSLLPWKQDVQSTRSPLVWIKQWRKYIK